MILVDVTIHYTWVFVLSCLMSSDVILSFESFQSFISCLSKKYHSAFDQNLIGGAIICWITANKSKIIATLAYYQSSNRLDERTWQTILEIACSYVTKKQVGHEFWFYAICHAA